MLIMAVSSKLFYLFMFYTQCLQQYSQQVGNINTFLSKIIITFYIDLADR